MKHVWTAIALIAPLMLASQPVYAQSRPQGACTQQSSNADCLKLRHAQTQKAHKLTKHRGKNIDPITTCAVSKTSPCMPKRR